MRELLGRMGKDYKEHMSPEGSYSPLDFARGGGMGMFLRRNLAAQHLGLSGEHSGVLGTGTFNEEGEREGKVFLSRFGKVHRGLRSEEQHRLRGRARTEFTGGDTTDSQDRTAEEADLAAEATIIRQTEGTRIDQLLHPRQTLEVLDKDVTEDLKEITAGKDKS